jgi:hypothetical protein
MNAEGSNPFLFILNMFRHEQDEFNSSLFIFDGLLLFKQMRRGDVFLVKHIST